MTGHDMALLRRMVNEGLSSAAIARVLLIAHTTVLHHCKQLGLRVRDSHANRRVELPSM